MKISELKLNKVRKTIVVNTKEGEQTIVIYNPIGKERKELLDILMKSNQEEGTTGEQLVKEVIEKFTNIEVDAFDLDECPTDAYLLVSKEIDEICYEIQLEQMVIQLRNMNQNHISTLVGLQLKKAKEIKEIIDELGLEDGEVI